MKTVCTLALVLLLLGAAPLFAEPEVEGAPTLGLSEPFDVGEGTADVLVKALDEKAPWRVRVDATFLRIDADQADQVLKEHRPEMPGSAREVPEALARRLIGAVRGSGAVRSEPPPPLLLFDGQSGRLSATGRHTYLQDYDVEMGMGPPVYTAIVGQLEDGTRLDVTPRRDAKRLALVVDVVWAELVRPVPRFEAKFHYKPERVTIELPEMRLFQLKKTARLPAAGGYLLAGGGRAWDGTSLRLVVIEVRTVKR